MAESTTVNLVQPAASACDGAAAANDVAAPLEPDLAGDDERPSTSTGHADDGALSQQPLPLLSSVIAPTAAAQSVVVALHRIASTTIPAAAAVPVAAGSSTSSVRARSTSIAVPRAGSIRRSSTAVVLNVARTLRQQVPFVMAAKKEKKEYTIQSE